MAEQVNIQKTIYSREQLENVINTNFTELVPPSSSILPITPDISVSDFFTQYNTIFFDIPPSGSDESHLGLASRSLEYLGLSLEDLQSEIDFLRQENAELKNQIIQISNINPGDLEDI
jgi:hypothetical protein